MPQAVVFPDQESCDKGLAFLQSAGFKPVVLEVPEFAEGLVADVAIIPVEKRINADDLAGRGLKVCGIIPHYPTKREIPQANALDVSWREIIGDLELVSIRRSLTDPARLRCQMTSGLDLSFIIPFMAQLIRGGVFHPDKPLLAFEEERRLIALSGRDIVISRADDLTDFWIVLRTLVELIISAWDNQHTIEPETQSRQGIGTVELFRRLPGLNCGQCQRQTCMEFATGLLTRSCSVEECTPIMDGDPQYLTSLLWLLGALGLDRAQSD
jgi:ArsR family metal-binding transcriptional regulator